MKNQIIRLALDGHHTFNPVYLKDSLIGSKFSEIASMIRAAAKNFSGRSHEAPIWENSAFNLTKNVVIYCAAVKGYYTLSDIYEAMLQASDKTLIKELGSILLEKEFSAEECYNIKVAIKYFEEFLQFEDKFRSGVLVTATTFLNQFQDYQVSKIFCPREEELSFKSMDEIIDNQVLLLVDIENESLSKSIGTFVKLHFEKSVLNRLKNPARSKEHMAIIVADEYQDLASVSHGAQIGDEKVLAKGREANFFFLAASQSITSIYNSVRDEKASKELIQNFRTRIACHSSDIDTISNFKELLGQSEMEKVTKSISENSQKARRNYLLGGFDSIDANISESISTGQQKEYLVTGKEFSRLKTFESFAQIYDGVGTEFYKLFLKPYFLQKKNTAHKEILEMLNPQTSFWDKVKFSAGQVKLYLKRLAYMLFLLGSTKAWSFPNVCSVVNKPEFLPCLEFKITPDMCGWPIPRPCARFTYYVPQTFIEVTPRAGGSYFLTYPGAAVQLGSVQALPPFGAEGDEDTQSYHAHTMAVPFASLPFNLLPCGGTRIPKMCFDGMSEHIYQHWSTGISDKLQPNFLAWSLAPKACLIKGAVTSAVGGEVNFSPDSPMCSIPLPPLPSFLPSSHSACNGWGVFYPRMGSYNGPASLTGALMIASRMKSLSSEVFRSTPEFPMERWQMIGPGSSSCFSEGQNVGILETIKNVREIGRLTSRRLTDRFSGHLFVVWKQVSCTRDLAYVPVAQGALASMTSVCLGLGEL